MTTWRIPRRRFLEGGGVALLLAACGGGDDDERSDAATPSTTEPGGAASSGGSGSDDATASATALTVADFDGVGTCVLLPEKMAGPFPLDEQLDRRDVTEGLPGHPLRLGLRVVDTACAPVAGAAVEIWHTDATGDYSAFVDSGGGKDEAEGTTFLRGTQTAGADGIVEFVTLYPGWYPGRAVHIHVRVHVDGDIVVTSQLFFDEPYTEGVFGEAPYAELGLPDTSNASDGIAGDIAAEGTLLSTRAADTVNGAGTLALLHLAVA